MMTFLLVAGIACGAPDVKFAAVVAAHVTEVRRPDAENEDEAALTVRDVRYYYDVFAPGRLPSVPLFPPRVTARLVFPTLP